MSSILTNNDLTETAKKSRPMEIFHITDGYFTPYADETYNKTEKHGNVYSKDGALTDDRTGTIRDDPNS